MAANEPKMAKNALWKIAEKMQFIFFNFSRRVTSFEIWPPV